MFGRKARQIANQAIMIANARKDSHEYLSSLVEKNKQIIALNDAIEEHAQQIEDLRMKVTRAEGSADAAIQAGGIISDQLRVAQAAIAEKDAVIQDLSQSNNEKSRNNVALGVKVEWLKADKEKLTEALRRARIQLDAYAADDERKPGKPGTATTRRPRLDFGQDVEALISAEGEPSKATPPGSQQ